jgi:hypothetical protein
MAAMVLILTALSFFWPDSGSQENSRNLRASTSVELTDWAAFDADLQLNSEMSYGQVLTDIYYPESERESTDGNRQ